MLASGARVHVFAAVDHCNAGCIGGHAVVGANRRAALETVRQGIGRDVGAAPAPMWPRD